MCVARVCAVCLLGGERGACKECVVCYDTIRLTDTALLHVHGVDTPVIDFLDISSTLEKHAGKAADPYSVRGRSPFFATVHKIDKLQPEASTA